MHNIYKTTRVILTEAKKKSHFPHYKDESEAFNHLQDHIHHVVRQLAKMGRKYGSDEDEAVSNAEEATGEFLNNASVEHHDG